MHFSRSRPLLYAVPVLTVLLAACEPTAPTFGTGAISPGATVTGGESIWGRDTVFVTLGPSEAIGLEISAPLGASVTAKLAGAQFEFVYTAGTTAKPGSVIAHGPIGGGRLLIEIANDGGGENNPYVLKTFRANPQPETAAASLNPGQVVGTETFGAGSDMDRFVVVGPAGTEYVARVRVPAGTTFAGWVRYLENEPSARLEQLGPAASDALYVTRTMTLGATPDTLFLMAQRARSAPGAQTAIPYEAEIYAINRAPEQNAARIGFDAPVVERFDRSGDVDEFEIEAQPGDMLRIEVPAPLTLFHVLSERTDPDGSVTGPFAFEAGEINGRTGFMYLNTAGLYRLRLRTLPQVPDGVTYTLRAEHRSAGGVR